MSNKPNKLGFLLEFSSNIGGAAQEIVKEIKKVFRIVDNETEKGEESFSSLDFAIAAFAASADKALHSWADGFSEDLAEIGGAMDKVTYQFGMFGGQIVHTLTSPGLMAATALYKAFESANSLEKTTKILKQTTTATAEETEVMVDAIRKMNREQGIAINQGGALMASLLKVGYSAEELAANVKHLGDLHHATEIDTQTLTATFYDLRKSLGLTGDQFEDVGFRIATLGKAADNINPEQMANAFGHFGILTEKHLRSLSDRTGVSLKDLNDQLVTSFAKLGFIGETGARSIVDKFVSTVDDPKMFQQVRMLGNYVGEEFDQALQRGDLSTAIDEMVKGMSEISDTETFAQMTSEFEKLFGVSADLVAQLGSKEGQKSMAEFGKRLKLSAEQVGSLSEAAHKAKTPFDRMMIEVDKLQDALVPLGEAIMDLVTAITPLITYVVECVTAFLSLGEESAVFNYIILAMIAAFTGVGEVIAKVIKLLFNFKGMIGTVWKNLSIFASRLMTLGRSIMTFFGNVLTAITLVADFLVAVLTPIIGGTLASILAPLLAVIAVFWGLYEIVKMVFGIDLIDEYIKYFTWGWGVLIDSVKGAATEIYDAFAALFGWIGDQIGVIGDAIASAWNFLFGDDEKDVTVKYSGGQAPATPLAISGPALDKTSPNLADFGVKQSNETEAEATKRESIELQRQMVEQLKAGNDDRDAKMGESYARRHN